MNDEPGRLFEVLEPPRGGLAGLRARIEREGRRHRRVRFVRLAAAVAVILAAVGLTLLVPRGGGDLPEIDLTLARMRLGLLPGPPEPLTVPADRRADLAARRVPLETDDVVFYLVASRRVDPPETGPAPAKPGPG